MALKTGNDYVSLNSLVLTLYIFSIYFQMTKFDILSLTITQQAIVMLKAIKKVK